MPKARLGRPVAVATVILAMGLPGQPTEAQMDSTLARVQAVAPASLGSGRVLFSVGHEERAATLAQLIEDASEHLRSVLGVAISLQVAVLNPEDWERVWPIPYGIPYLSVTRPWVAVLPADPRGSVMYPAFESLLGSEAARTMLDNIGYHEVGHAYVSEFAYSDRASGAPPVRWLDELLATLLAYSSLTEVAEERARVWDDFTQRSLELPLPDLTTLEAFETEYNGALATEEGAANYSWYQAAFARRAAAIHEANGMTFLVELRARLLERPPASWTTAWIVSVVDSITDHNFSWDNDVSRWWSGT